MSKIDEVLSPAEEAIMKTAFAVTMTRAADILDQITEDDVADAQIVLFAEGCTIQQCARIDRARLGAAHLRACALNLDPRQASVIKKLIFSGKRS